MNAFEDAQGKLKVYGARQAAMVTLSRSALRGVPVQELMELAARLVAETLGLEFSLVAESAAGNGPLVLRAGIGWREGLIGESAAALELGSIADYALLTGAPVIVEDWNTETRFEPTAPIRGHGVASGAAVAIQGGGGPLGVLGAFSVRPGARLGADEINFMQAIANVLGLALDGDRFRRESRRGEQQLRSLVQHSHDLITACEKDGAIRFVSAAVERIIGLKPENVVGKSVYDIFAGRDEAAREVIGRALADPDAVVMMQYTVRHRDGSERILEATGSRASDGCGGEWAVFSSRDITERVQAQRKLSRSEAKFRAVFESSLDGIALVSLRTLRYVEVNEAFLVMFGYSRERVIGRTPAEIGLVGSDSELLGLTDELAAAGSVRNCECDLMAADGGVVTAQISSVLRMIDGDTIVMSFMRDIAAQKRAERELARARDIALEASRLKSTFLANTSHEIRTPLNIILGYGDLIGEHLIEIGDSSQMHYVEAVSRAGKRLLATIDGILDYSRLEAGAFDAHPIRLALAAVIEREINDARVLSEAKGLELSWVVEVPNAVIYFDQHCLSGAIGNLLKNAIKFTDRGGIGLRLYRDQADALCLAINDSGIGIDKTFLPQLFEPFSQEQSNVARQFEGAGLGLALTRKYLELNGAGLSVTSEKGAGTTFTIHFAPHRGRAFAPARHETLLTPQRMVSGAPRILVVEDDSETQGYMRAALGSRYEVKVAASTAEARRELAVSNPANLILMDLALKGGEDGLQLVRALRAESRWKNIPIVALTAYAAPEDRTRALAAGCDVHLSKPVDRQMLFAAINGLLRKRNG
ncbi:MAG: PAS domain S-box protein [Candidatus Binataceae bacterium]